LLQRTNEPLDDGDARWLADGSEPGPDTATLAPTLEASTPELRALVQY
jgi:hypothetical protein